MCALIPVTVQSSSYSSGDDITAPVDRRTAYNLSRFVICRRSGFTVQASHVRGIMDSSAAVISTVVQKNCAQSQRREVFVGLLGQKT